MLIFYQVVVTIIYTSMETYIQVVGERLRCVSHAPRGVRAVFPGEHVPGHVHVPGSLDGTAPTSQGDSGEGRGKVMAEFSLANKPHPVPARIAGDPTGRG